MCWWRCWGLVVMLVEVEEEVGGEMEVGRFCEMDFGYTLALADCTQHMFALSVLLFFYLNRSEQCTKIRCLLPVRRLL
jgi:hypothetical protein